MNNEMTINEFLDVFNYLIENNKRLEEASQTPIAIGLEGVAGIGKTSVVESYAKSHGMTFCKLNLSELEEVGDLAGYPVKEHLAVAKTKDGNKVEKWIPEQLLSKLPDTVKVTTKTRMGYAKPAWLPQDDNPNGTILLLDDFSRANSLFMQAVMELINTCSYVSWSLPKNTTVVLTSNPDDGSYSVTSLDEAQSSRFMNFFIKADSKSWASWAENSGIDGRAINFALMYWAELFKRKNNSQTVNPRSYVTFCKAINGIKNWSDENSLALILQISKGCFLNDKENMVGTLFTTFISNHMDRLIQPKDMLMGSWDTVKNRIADCVYDNGKFKSEISSVLAIRLLNYILYYFSQKGVKENVVEDRLLDIIEYDTKLFSDDLLFHLIKTVVAKYPARTGRLMLNKKIRDKILI